jgi:MerR family copper efflux transcriptional regulator
MYIGEFSKRVGTTTKTIRHYEAIGLLPQATRQGRYRVYDERYIETVKQIRLAQSLGFSLAEIKAHCQNANIRYGLPKQVLLAALANREAQLKAHIANAQNQLNNVLALRQQLDNSNCT